MEKIDYKKEYKDLYMPKQEPQIIKVPTMKFIMVKGKGNPNQEDGEYADALKKLYALSFTIKMSKMGNQKIEGYFDYVVPPLEGLWWSKEGEIFDQQHKEKFEWISMIRQPEFVTNEVFQWACEEVKLKKGLNTENVEFREFSEGLCVQCMHRGSYNEEAKTIEKIADFIKKENYKNDIGTLLENGMIRYHHEIYLSDPRKTKAENLKTVIRIPICKN